MFLTYDEYDSMDGTVPEEEFEVYERRARALINATTHNRIRDENPVRACVKNLTFDLVNLMAQEAANANNAVTGMSSQHNDGVSVTYANWTTVNRYWKTRRRETLVEYLADETVTIDGETVPLLYGGVEYDGGVST